MNIGIIGSGGMGSCLDHRYQPFCPLHHTYMGGARYNGQAGFGQSMYTTHFSTAFDSKQLQYMLISCCVGNADGHEYKDCGLRSA